MLSTIFNVFLVLFGIGTLLVGFVVVSIFIESRKGFGRVPQEKLPGLPDEFFQQIASTNGVGDGSIISTSNTSPGQPLIMNLTSLTGSMAVGHWKTDNHFEVVISKELSLEEITEIKKTISPDKCRITIKHETSTGLETIYDC